MTQVVTMRDCYDNTMAFDYDGLGRRVLADDGNSVTWYRSDLGFNVVGTYADLGDWMIGNPTTLNVNAGGTVLAHSTGSTPYTHHVHDHLSSV